jgi:UDP-glucose 4-epimerase
VGEAFLRSYCKEYGLSYTIFRFFNTYGPKQSIDFVISKFLVNALKNEDITIYGDGEQTRTFCYIDDNVDTTIKALYEEKVVNDVINIGGSREITINELAKVVIELTKSKSKLKYLPPLEEGDMKRRRPDNTEMKSILGRDLMSLKDGLAKIIEKGLYEYNENR